MCVCAHLQSSGSELVRCFLNCSFRSLLTPMSWNIRCSLDVYSKPHACCRRKRRNQNNPADAPHPHTHTRCLECVTSAHACDSDLEFGDHAGLGVVAGAVLVDQTFGQHLGVKLLENVFVLDVLEHNHLREETAWSLWFHCKTKTSPYREARVTASHHLVQSVLQFSLLWVFGAEKETKTNKMLFSISFGG